MEDDAGSTVTNQMATIREGSSESNTIFHLPRRCRPEPTSSTRFKGVVLQQNGNWGAQIYANHQRIWLGTLKSEMSAAVAYDRAATKLRNSDPNRNFPCLAAYELMFQNVYNTDAVLGMIRNGSYESKLAEFLRSTGNAPSEVGAPGPPAGHLADHNGVTFHELFQKELTPSDVGKLNRLVIPKKHAVKHFPGIETTDRERGGWGGCKGIDDGATEGIMLEFRDLQDRSWEFRYCYWKSSQSFVFTKGWNRFVKTKDLRAKDVVTFYSCEDREGVRGTFFLIDVGRGGAGNEGDFFGCVRSGVRHDEWGMKLGVGGGGMFGFGSKLSASSGSLPEEMEGEVMLEPSAASGLQDKKGIRLFGVQIGER